MEGELSDRFGKMPPELKNLLAVLFTKQKMKRLGIEKLESGERSHSFFLSQGGLGPD